MAMAGRFTALVAVALFATGTWACGGSDDGGTDPGTEISEEVSETLEVIEETQLDTTEVKDVTEVTETVETVEVVETAEVVEATEVTETAEETSETVEPWPPATWYTATECALPACDTTAAQTFNHSGKWTLTTTTVSTDCNEVVQGADPRFAVGAVHTGSAHDLLFTGSCDYQPDGTSQMGTFKNNVEITCVVQDRPLGVKSLETGVVTFVDDGTASGVATVHLFNLPDAAGQAGNGCKIEMTVAMNRVEPWPPTQPWYTDTACQLPTCNSALTLPFSFSGEWALTTTTVSTTCNELVQTSDPRFVVGAVHTGSNHALSFQGGCDFAPDGATIGTFKDSTEITCQVQDRPLGVKSREIGVVSFTADGHATGTASVRLFNLPDYAAQDQNACDIEMTVELDQQVP